VYSRSDNSHFQNETAENRVSLSETKQAYSHSDCFDVSLSREGEVGKGEQSGVPMRSEAPGPAGPEAANGQTARSPTPPAHATASLNAPLEETAPPPSLVPDPASDPPKETAASSPTLASSDLVDIPAFLDRRRKSALADGSAR
jgi:hypothetical protein